METQEKIRLYRIAQPYLQYLHKIEPKVMCNKEGMYDRPHVGILLIQNGHRYFAPLSSYKPSKHDKINNHSIFKILDTDQTKLAVIQFNNMIPILDSVITEMDFEKEKEDYKILLQKEYLFISRNSDDICEKAEKLYKDVVEKQSSFFTRISNNFTLLEEKYTDFPLQTPSKSL